jgi:CheY-like chemotaxis protein
MNNVLVVDDDRTILEVFTRLLEGAGMVAHCVSSGKAALEKLAERSFSLMITDYNMPGLDGLELAIKVHEMVPQLPIIMNTSSLAPDLARLARDIGIARIMVKPSSPDEILEGIWSVVGKGPSPQPCRRPEMTQAARPS